MVNWSKPSSGATQLALRSKFGAKALSAANIEPDTAQDGAARREVWRVVRRAVWRVVGGVWSMACGVWGMACGA